MKTAINPIRTQNFSEWYQQVIKAADLAETSAVRGCMTVKPHGFAIWEKMQSVLDRRFKETGHQNCYFPLLIPLSYLEKEAEHVEGFAKECAVVTHRRLVKNDEGGLSPDGELQEPYVIRPTSEMIIGESFSRWINSYRDLPVKINQWANVMRWEMRPRVFLRTAEFLWQEGHTAHATKEEAIEETLLMHQVYKEFFEEYLAIPVIAGQKTESEKFPGADATYTIEAIMQDGKALQAGTSHFLGQNFSKAQNIKYLADDKTEKHCWTTSWGVSTRMIGGLIMSHSDDDGLVLPPKIASTHIRILPIFRKEEEKELVENFVADLVQKLKGQTFSSIEISVDVDNRDIRGGEKYWSNVKKGYPLILEVGPRDVKNNSVFMTRRDLGAKEKQSLTADEFVAQASSLLDSIQDNLFTKAKERFDEAIVEVNSLDEFNKLFKKKTFPAKQASLYIADCEKTQKILADKQLSFRCIPLDEEENLNAKCLFTDTPVTKRVVIGPSY